MHLEGIPLAPLGTLQDSLYQAVWTRREQMRIFETLINVLASGLSLNPSVSKKIEKLMDEYINLVIPGAEQAKKKADEAFVTKTASALSDVAKLLPSHSKKSGDA